MKKARAITVVSLILIALTLFSGIVSAAFFQSGLAPIESFFSGGWMEYHKTMTFLAFFFLFFCAFLIGMKNAMKDLTRPHIVFCFVAAFMAAFIITTTTGFDTTILKYVVWGVLGLLLFALLYYIFSKMGMKFWGILLALLLTALLLWLLWYLMQDGVAFKGISNPFRGFGTVRSPWSRRSSGGFILPPQQQGGVYTPPSDVREWPKWLWILPILLLLLLGATGRYIPRRWRNPPGVRDEDVNVRSKEEAIKELERILQSKNRLITEMKQIAMLEPPDGLAIPNTEKSRQQWIPWLIPPLNWTHHAVWWGYNRWDRHKKRNRKLYETVWELWKNHVEYAQEDKQLLKTLEKLEGVEKSFINAPHGKSGDYDYDYDYSSDKYQELIAVCNEVLALINSGRANVAEDVKILAAEDIILDHQKGNIQDRKQSDWCQKRIDNIKAIVALYENPQKGKFILDELLDKLKKQIQVLKNLKGKEKEPEVDVEPIKDKADAIKGIKITIAEKYKLLKAMRDIVENPLPNGIKGASGVQLIQPYGKEAINKLRTLYEDSLTHIRKTEKRLTLIKQLEEGFLSSGCSPKVKKCCDSVIRMLGEEAFLRPLEQDKKVFEGQIKLLSEGKQWLEARGQANWAEDRARAVYLLVKNYYHAYNSSGKKVVSKNCELYWLNQLIFELEKQKTFLEGKKHKKLTNKAEAIAAFDDYIKDKEKIMKKISSGKDNEALLEKLFDEYGEAESYIDDLDKIEKDTVEKYKKLDELEKKWEGKESSYDNLYDNTYDNQYTHNQQIRRKMGGY